MRRFMLGAVALALMTIPAVAQTSSGSSGQTPQATSPNSGAGVQGKPGNKNGPPANSSETTGANSGTNSSMGNAGTTPQDASKIPGMTGNKSGPPARKPSDSSAK
jgi:hypothetical protein